MGRVEIFQGRARRRWSEEAKHRLVAETFAPGETVHGVARRHGVNTSQLFTWRKRYGAELGRAVPGQRVPGFAAVEITPVPPPLVGDAAGAPCGLIEIELPGGSRMRISGAADPALVGTALRVLTCR